MIRDITIGQYYPVDSPIHRLDPRTKLFGTMIYIISLFFADNLWCYLIATLFLTLVVRLSKVPFKFIVKGLKAIVFLLLISVSFNLFLTDGREIFRLGFLKITAEGLSLAFFYGPASDVPGAWLIDHDADDDAEPAHGRPGKEPRIYEQASCAGS